ncbi:hypothetical protein Q3G72_024457 [Acer saccharum]|nr:hypothetical protein Q3G72_024457 [Acer saccharum]
MTLSCDLPASASCVFKEIEDLKWDLREQLQVATKTKQVVCKCKLGRHSSEGKLISFAVNIYKFYLRQNPAREWIGGSWFSHQNLFKVICIFIHFSQNADSDDGRIWVVIDNVCDRIAVKRLMSAGKVVMA